MKIILICESVFPENKGGLERWITWYAEKLANLSFEVEYINASGINEIRQGVKYTSATTRNWRYNKNGKRSIKQSLNFAFSIRPIIRDSKPDVIYSVQAPIFSLFSLGLFFRRPWLLIVEWIEIWSLNYWRSYLGFIRGTIGFYIQTLAQRVGDIRVVFTQRCLNQLSRQTKKNVLLPGLCMPQRVLALDSFKKRENLLFLGRFVGEKQPFLALQVARELRNLGWTGCLNFVGTGPLANLLEKEIMKNEMRSFVQMRENASQDQLEEYFNNTFLLFHPSKREGYGLAMIESAERGIPTLLIDYPENASIDIKIPSQIVASTENPKTLATLALEAYLNQEANFHSLRDWRNKSLPNMQAQKSVEKIVSLINEFKKVE